MDFWLPLIFMVVGAIGVAGVVHALEKKFYSNHLKGSDSDGDSW